MITIVRGGTPRVQQWGAARHEHGMPRTQKPKPLNTGVLLTREEAAARLGCSPNTLRNLGHQRRGPHYAKVGRRAMYPEDEVLRVLQVAIEGGSLAWAS